MRIAIVGSGIAGNVVAHRLHRLHDVAVYEAAEHIGGHTHTHVVEHETRTFHVDTGFIVYNDWTYPNFVALLDELGVASQESAMSFSVRDEASGLEYNGTSLNTLLAQRANIVRPAFLGMIRDILRFNREAPHLLADADDRLTLGEYLERNRYGRAFIEHYVVPMGAAIWSTDAGSMREFPAHFFVRFFANHGMLSVNRRPTWRVIRGGSARYVEKLTAPFRHRIRLATPVESVRRTAGGVVVKAHGEAPCRYDAVFLACHSDQALRLLADPSPAEESVLGAIPYQENVAVLHTDVRLMPRRKLAWAAWNYHAGLATATRVALTYNMNVLQGLASDTPLLVTLNREDDIDPRRVMKRIVYHHPIYTPAGVAAQARHAEIDGVRNTYYCGAYWRNGFHEDGVVSALQALAHFHQRTGHEERALRRTA